MLSVKCKNAYFLSEILPNAKNGCDRFFCRILPLEYCFNGVARFEIGHFRLAIFEFRHFRHELSRALFSAFRCVFSGAYFPAIFKFFSNEHILRHDVCAEKFAQVKSSRKSSSRNYKSKMPNRTWPTSKCSTTFSKKILNFHDKHRNCIHIYMLIQQVLVCHSI